MKIFIIGGTSGIGLALAEKYLQLGNEVAVGGRDLSKLPKNLNGVLQGYQFDVYDTKILENAIIQFSQNKLDLLIFSSGYYADDSLKSISYEESENMLKVNILGAIYALEIARKIMYKNKSGHIALIASVSGLLDYPQATTYSKTKAALIKIAEAYQKILKSVGINITIIAPGYVNTQKLREINNGDLSKKPFVVSTDFAVKEIIKGIEENKQLVVFPLRIKLLIYILSCFPAWMMNKIMHKKAAWYQKK